MQAFIKASRLKLRFSTPQGLLSVEDLWDLPLSVEYAPANRAKPANLDDIAIGLNKQLEETGNKSFVKKASAVDEATRLKFDIVLYVIEVRQEEAELAEKKASDTLKKQQIMALIADKENEAMKGRSVDELRALLAEL